MSEGPQQQGSDLTETLQALIDRCVKAETALAIEAARARYWSDAARGALKAKTLERAHAILTEQQREDMGLICILTR